MPSKYVDTLFYWHDYYNQLLFNGKLQTIGMGFTRSRTKDGFFEHHTAPRRKSYIRINRALLEDEETLLATIVHEMIHQYQHEILGHDTHHDSVFRSIARHLEKVTGLPIR